MITHYAESIPELAVTTAELYNAKHGDAPTKRKADLLSTANLLTGGITGGLAGIASGVATKNPYVGLGMGLAGLGIGTAVGYSKDKEEFEQQYNKEKLLYDMFHSDKYRFIPDEEVINDVYGK